MFYQFTTLSLKVHLITLQNCTKVGFLVFFSHLSKAFKLIINFLKCLNKQKKKALKNTHQTKIVGFGVLRGALVPLTTSLKAAGQSWSMLDQRGNVNQEVNVNLS